MIRDHSRGLTRRTFFRTLGVFGGSAVLAGVLTGCEMLGDLYGGRPPQDGEAVETDTVEMRDIAFRPRVIEVEPGTNVTWINRDNVEHTVTKPGLFDSGNLAFGERFEFTFEEPGTYDYVCTIHPGMSGRVIVEASMAP